MLDLINDQIEWIDCRYPLLQPIVFPRHFDISSADVALLRQPAPLPLAEPLIAG